MNAPKRLLPVLPTTWIDGQRRGHRTPGPATPVMMPSEEEVSRYGPVAEALEELRVCGACRFFDHQGGREEIMRQRFLERLVREEEWKLEHLGAPPDDLGLCGQSNGEMVTSKMASAHNCDMFRRAR